MRENDISRLVYFCICGGLLSLLAFAGCRADNNNARTVNPEVGGNKADVRVLAVIPENVPNVFKVEFDERGRGVATILQVPEGVRAALNGRIGRPYQSMGEMTLSPDGKHIAYSALDKDGTWRMVTDETEGMAVREIGSPVFSPDSRHLAYDAKIDGKWTLVIDGKIDRASAGDVEFTDKFFSSDSSTFVFIRVPNDRVAPARVTVSDVNLQKRFVKEMLLHHFALNDGRARMAYVRPVNGKQRVVEFAFAKPDIVYEGPLYDAIEQPACPLVGTTMTYFANKGGKRYLVLNGKEELMPKSEEITSFVVRPDKRGVGIIMRTKKGVFLHQAFYNKDAKEKVYDDAGGLIYNKDGSRHAYIAARGKHIFMVVDGRECQSYDMIVTPEFSPDGRFLTYRARKDGKRFIVIADASGTTLRQLPPYELVFPPVFSADGKTISYGAKDGRKLTWNVDKLP